MHVSYRRLRNMILKNQRVVEFRNHAKGSLPDVQQLPYDMHRMVFNKCLKILIPKFINRQRYQIVRQHSGMMQFLNGTNGSDPLKSSKLILASTDSSHSCGTLWEPNNIFSCPLDNDHAVVILNNPINLPQNLLINMWDKAQVRVTVDGGTDCWLQYIASQLEIVPSSENAKFLPDFVTGDMDSILPETLEKLRSLKVPIVVTPDQNATDFTKALQQLGTYTRAKNLKLDVIYVISETSGRFDHILANVNTLFKSEKLLGDAQVIQVSSKSLTWLLRPGRHKISISEALIQDQTWCALIPVGCPVKNITTTGLKWNLENATLEFGGLVSTSNTYDNLPEVTVITDAPVVWSMDIGPLVETSDSSATPP